MIDGRAGRIGVLLSLVLVAASCDDSYTFPIIELDRSQHAGTPILGTWKVDEFVGEREGLESASRATFESDEEGRLWMRFSDAPQERRRCAALGDRKELLVSCLVATTETDGRWILVKLRFVASGEVLEVFLPRADQLRSAVRGGTLAGRLETFEVPDDLIEIQSPPERLRKYFLENELAFPDRPAVVLSRVWPESTSVRRRTFEVLETDLVSDDPSGVSRNEEETRG